MKLVMRPERDIPVFLDQRSHHEEGGLHAMMPQAVQYPGGIGVHRPVIEGQRHHFILRIVDLPLSVGGQHSANGVVRDRHVHQGSFTGIQRFRLVMQGQAHRAEHEGCFHLCFLPAEGIEDSLIRFLLREIAVQFVIGDFRNHIPGITFLSENVH